VWVDGDEREAQSLVASALHMVELLEKRWSRFVVGSDLSRLNRSAGSFVAVDGSTADLLATAVAAWERTNGRFDPTVGQAVIDAGYDRSFEQLEAQSNRLSAREPHGPQRGEEPPARLAAAAPGCAGIAIDRVLNGVTIPYGTRLDFGGIGKGRIADIVAAAAVAAGARSVCVSLGGDARLMGSPPMGDRWVVAVGDPLGFGAPFETLGIGGAGGAVATSSTQRRRWPTAEGFAHHIIDPRTGAPSTSPVVAATVVAADATWAEVYAKAAVIAGPDDGRRLIADAGLAGLLVTRSGDGVGPGDLHCVHAGPIADYLVPS
jgi:FAD:protein FMN transferase